VSNADEKEKKSPPDSMDDQAKSPKKEPLPKAASPAEEPAPLLQPEKAAPPHTAKTYPKSQRKTIFFGADDLVDLEAELPSASNIPKPPSIHSQRVVAVAHSPASLPTPTPEALNAQAAQPEPVSLSKNTSVTSSGVLGIPSESLLSPEDHGGAFDPSETLSSLLDEVFSEEIPGFAEDIFRAPDAASPDASFAASSASLPHEKVLEAAPSEAPPWDPVAAMVTRQTQTQFPLTAHPEASPPQLPPSDFVIPGARTPLAPEPSVSLFEGTTETQIETHLAITQEIPRSTKPPVEPSPTEAAEATVPLESPPPPHQSPLISLAEKETADSIMAAEPIFYLSSQPRFVDPESRPAAAMAPIFRSLEKTHEAVPAPLPRLLGAFLVDALLLCSASLGMLWAAKAFTEPSLAPAKVSSWFGSVAAWQILGPAGVALLALLAVAYATFFAIVWNGATPGRKLLSLKLVNREGHTIGFFRAFVRSLFSLLSFGLALSGFWWALIDKRRQTLHDKCTGTFVVRVQPKP
jgi:uncharacterized RDD family membrane protein YckC